MFETINNDQITDVKPFLRWAGSKQKIITQLMKEVPNNYNIYHEPFAGSAQLLFAIQPEQAFINDINEELINVYKTITTNPIEIFHKVNSFDISKDNYYKLRAQHPDVLSKIERSARFIILNRLCYNGLYRVNKKGQFNVPYNNNLRNGKLPTLNDFLNLQTFFSKFNFESKSYEEVILSKSNVGDFIFFDPPYSSGKIRMFSEYTQKSFDESEFPKLFDIIEEIDRRGVKFILTYNDCEDVRRYIDKYRVKTLQVKRSINCSANHRNKNYSELLIKNY